MSATVTIGIPVYRGGKFLEETVDSVLAQSLEDWRVIFSVDGPDPVCEKICRQYLADQRFSLEVQSGRLGWVNNVSWLQRQADTEFWCYQQQDDLIDPLYLETLVQHARRWPDAAVVYCDIQAFGERQWHFARPSVLGSPVARQLTLLTNHFAGVAFRGLTRVEALRKTDGGLFTNEVEDFAADTVWMAAMATWGELIQVPTTLYRKRYHAGNAHTSWTSWDKQLRMTAWIAHCSDMFQVASRVSKHRSDSWSLWVAMLGRLTASRATSYLPWSEFTPDDKVALFDELLGRIRRLGRIHLPDLLGGDWSDIRRRSMEVLRVTR